MQFLVVVVSPALSVGFVLMSDQRPWLDTLARVMCPLLALATLTGGFISIFLLTRRVWLAALAAILDLGMAVMVWWFCFLIACLAGNINPMEGIQ